MSHPPVIVISVPGGKRHKLAEAHLGTLGLASLLSPAVFVQTTAEEVTAYDHSKRLRELGYGLTKGEIGCFLAHQTAWEQVVRLGQTSLILEDDARLDSRLISLLRPTADSIAEQAMLVRFYSVKHPRHKTWRTLPGGFELVRPLSSGGSTVAYLITPECARKLLAGSRRFWLAVDEYMDDEASHGTVVLHGFPEWVRHEDEGASLVGARTKPRMSVAKKIQREWRRLLRNIRQSAHRETVLWKLGLRF
jgi:GR25 family glycosyltransferase involved in LPS biosynthesis